MFDTVAELLPRLPRVEALIGCRLSEIDVAVVYRIVALHIREDTDLDFKREVYAQSDKGYRGKPSFVDGRMPGYSRWPGQREVVWRPVAPEVVCEVAGSNIDGGRFRHSLRFLRWRPDRDAWDCRTGQLG